MDGFRGKQRTPELRHLRVRQGDPPVQRLGGVKGQDALRVWK